MIEAPFYMSATFAFCCVVIVVLIIVFPFVVKRASAKASMSDSRCLVDLAKDDNTKGPLRRVLKWDFLLIAVYTSANGLICFVAGRFADEFGFNWSRVTWLVMSLVLVGALIDIIENLALLRIIKVGAEPLNVSIARLGNVLKWFFPAIGIIYAVVIGIRILFITLLSRT
jgi:hypothetical protein